MTRTIPLILSLVFIFSTAFSQETLSWRKHKRLADKLLEAHQYADAAEHYEKAWQEHSQDKSLTFQAGECFYQIKDFKKAAQSYQYVQKDNEQFPLVGLKYARSLKQDGQYAKASQAFIYFINAYQGDDKAILTAIVSNEIKGCEQGLSAQASQEKSDIQIKHLSENINSPEIEFAPIPFTEDLLYFSSTMQGNQACLFRSQRKNGIWKKAVVADGLPPLPPKHLANGSFAPGAKRFYFTLCEEGEGLSSRCEIYLLKRENSKWSPPIRLRDYINVEGATTTQPWVVHQNGLEILYFSSDRTDGMGGMDIWYTTRNINSDDIDFTYPINAGREINTIGDEITPFYNTKNKTLYFSSNGKITLGGWDIFSAEGTQNKWENVQNLGTPINSSADDFYYVQTPSRNSGFFVSNRLFGLEKISTRHEDIFEFGKKEKKEFLHILGQVIEGKTKSPISDVRISLYELVGGREKLLSSKKISQPDYRFKVLPDKKLRLIAEKSGYLKNTYDFDTYNADFDADYKHTFALSPKSMGVITMPKEKTIPTYTASTNREDISIVTRKRTNTASSPTAPPAIKTSVTTSPAVVAETYYKVQLIAVNFHNENHPRYEKIKALGSIETEELERKGIIRVLLANYFSKTEAHEVMKKAKDAGFLDAFVVEYKNGKRIKRIW